MPDLEWFGLEVQRPVLNTPDKNDVECRDEIFCSQEHAALWLQTPLSAPEPTPQFAGSQRNAGVILGLVAVVFIGLLGVGVVTVGRWLLSLF